jgi:hypothetical protein
MQLCGRLIRPGRASAILPQGIDADHADMTRAPLPILLCLAALSVAISACQAVAPQADLAAPCEAAAEPLANLAYTAEVVESGIVELEAGEYRAPAAPGSASEVVVQLTEDIACGDLNGQPSAAIVLVSAGGGSGTFSSLHAVQPLDGMPAEVAYTLLGDRVEVERVTIEGNRVLVDLITHSPDDPLCCPTQAVTQSYSLEGTELRLVSTTPRAAP